MKRLLMLAALAAFGMVGCKGSDHDQRVRNDMPMIGANGQTSNGNVVQTQYRPGSGMGVQQAGGMTGQGGIVVPAVGTTNVACPTGKCPNAQMPMTPADSFNLPPVR